MNCLFFSSISNHKFNAEEVIASSLLKTVRNRLYMVVVTGLEPVTSRTSNYLTNPKSLDI